MYQGYEKLTVFQKASKLVLAIYKCTRDFPKDEIFGLTSQARRAAVSVPANIVEGYGRRTIKDKLQFYYVARGSLNELEYCLELANDLGYLKPTEHAELANLRAETGKLLTGFIKSTGN